MCIESWTISKKKKFFLYGFQMRWLHFSIEKMVKKTTFWKSYINNGLVMYFEYRENTTVKGITIWSTLNSLLLLFCTFASCIHCSFLHTFIFWFSLFNLLCCYLLLKVLILFIQSPSDSNCFFFFLLYDLSCFTYNWLADQSVIVGAEDFFTFIEILISHKWQ